MYWTVIWRRHRKKSRSSYAWKTLISHNGKDLFESMIDPFTATHYHSLLIAPESMPDELEITAHTSEGEIMGIKAQNPAHLGCTISS